jgi:serine O-acetyltransferase
VGHYFYKKKLFLLAKVSDFLIRIIKNSVIYSSTHIGEGTIFAYGGIAVVIHKRAYIGKNCVIGTNVTIGGKSKCKNLPVIADHVYIATGAKVLGDISIGEGSVIGANAVVIKDVPARSIVGGIPAKIIKTNINYKDFY